MKLILRLLVTAFAVMLAAYIVPGIMVSSFSVAVIVALILGLINLTVKPILFVLTLPITILTLGLFALVLNALLLWFTASVIPGFSVEGFVPALLGSLIISLAAALFHRMLS